MAEDAVSGIEKENISFTISESYGSQGVSKQTLN